jgi:hypothetical protein
MNSNAATLEQANKLKDDAKDFGIWLMQGNERLTVEQIATAGKTLWAKYDRLSKLKNSPEVASALTDAAGKILEVTIDLLHITTDGMKPYERTKKLVDFVQDTDFRGRVLVAENVYLMHLQAFEPLLDILRDWAHRRHMDLESYLDLKVPKDGFSSNYSTELASTLEENESRSSVFNEFSSLRITAA